MHIYLEKYIALTTWSDCTQCLAVVFGQDQRSIGATKTEAVCDGNLDLFLLRMIWYQVESWNNIRLMQIQCWRDYVLLFGISNEHTTWIFHALVDSHFESKELKSQSQ